MKKPLNKFSTTYESFSRESRRGTQECVRHIVLTISLRQATSNVDLRFYWQPVPWLTPGIGKLERTAPEGRGSIAREGAAPAEARLRAEARPHRARPDDAWRFGGSDCDRLGEVDPSNGYEEIAGRFIAARNGRIGPATVREWSRTLPAGSSILDLGCGNGRPISQTLIEDGFAVYGVDASTKMIAAFRERFPGARAECSTVEDSTFFGRKFDGVIAWGLMILLPAESQAVIIKKVAGALNRGGTFLFTAPEEAVAWKDSLAGRESVSLGLPEYRELLLAEGLVLVGEESDEGGNHYYPASKSSDAGS